MKLTMDAPGPWVSANNVRNSHWRAVQPRLRVWRDAAQEHALALNPMPFFTEPVVLTAVIHKSTRAIYDPPNLLGGSVKAAVDGLVDAGVLAGDDSRFIVETRIRAGEVRKPSQLVLQIEVAR